MFRKVINITISTHYRFLFRNLINMESFCNIFIYISEAFFSVYVILEICRNVGSMKVRLYQFSASLLEGRFVFLEWSVICPINLSAHKQTHKKIGIYTPSLAEVALIPVFLSSLALRQ